MSAANANTTFSGSGRHVWAARPLPLAAPATHHQAWPLADWRRQMEAWVDYDHERRLREGVWIAADDHTLFLSDIRYYEALPDVSTSIRFWPVHV
jgi:hypothetical protein